MWNLKADRGCSVVEREMEGIFVKRGLHTKERRIERVTHAFLISQRERTKEVIKMERMSDRSGRGTDYRLFRLFLLQGDFLGGC